MLRSFKADFIQNVSGALEIPSSNVEATYVGSDPMAFHWVARGRSNKEVTAMAAALEELSDAGLGGVSHDYGKIVLLKNVSAHRWSPPNMLFACSSSWP